MRGKWMRAEPLLDGSLANHPIAGTHDRLVGFRVHEDVAGLSEGLFMLEALRAGFRAAPALADELAWIITFAEMRSKDDSKTFSRVNRGALRTIADRARAALSLANPPANHTEESKP